jgi:hypothetical protein
MSKKKMREEKPKEETISALSFFPPVHHFLCIPGFERRLRKPNGSST